MLVVQNRIVNTIKSLSNHLWLLPQEFRCNLALNKVDEMFEILYTILSANLQGKQVKMICFMFRLHAALSKCAFSEKFL